ncbi:zeta toxin family protein [Streptomyces broussonetiae]|uniref:zeta toxin family protein n=1 Tax=Streptomyces broussonetiae TaxID=2686304 RepID=UPI001E3FACC3|nr:zeta toxin family protein [Streptomyces broussonetiae]
MSWENHDTCAKNMLSTLAVIEAEELAERITIVRRDGTVLYTNERTTQSGGLRRPAAERVVRRERSRPWTAPETSVFRRELAHTDRLVHAELEDEDRRLVLQRDSERAAAWSEPAALHSPRRCRPGSRITGCRTPNTAGSSTS